MTDRKLRLPGLALGLALVLGLACAAYAEIPPLSPEELKADAQVIVVGEVRAVYSHDHEREKGADFVDTRYVAEVKVDAVEKGDVKAGSLVYIRYWRAKERPDGWAGPGGHRPLPAPGAKLRLYLRRGDDGGLDVLLPNGFEPKK